MHDYHIEISFLPQLSTLDTAKSFEQRPPSWEPNSTSFPIEIDDFDIINITHAGIAQPSANGGGEANQSIIGSYAMHLYPQSTCDSLRWHRMRLDLLSNHTTLWLNVSQYGPQVAAADMTGHPFVMGETNSL